MKTLFLMRHAKSSWDYPELSDYERPLNKRGKKAAPRIGVEMAERGYIPDYILSSSAKRAAETIRLAAESGEFDTEIEFERGIYGAGQNSLFYFIGQIPDTYQRAMLIGHNPGFEQLVEFLTGTYKRMPTAALAVVRFEAERWVDAAEGSGELTDYIIPKDLVD